MKATLNDLLNAKGVSEPLREAVKALTDRLEEAEADALEQARLNGMGSEREAALMAKLEAAEKEVAHIKEVEFPRKARAVAVGWETKCARLEQERDNANAAAAGIALQAETLQAERDALRAEIEAIHSLLDNDESKIIRNAKDGYPEGREPKELTLTERVTALCKYASDWERWCNEAEAKIEAMKKQEPVAIVDYKRGSCVRWVEYLGWQKIKDGTKLYTLPGAKGE